MKPIETAKPISNHVPLFNANRPIRRLYCRAVERKSSPDVLAIVVQVLQPPEADANGGNMRCKPKYWRHLRFQMQGRGLLKNMPFAAALTFLRPFLDKATQVNT